MRTYLAPFSVRLLACLVTFGLLLGSHAAHAQEKSPEDALRDAINSYEYGDLAKAIKQLRRLLFPRPGRLRKRSQRAEASRYLSFSYFFDRKRFDEKSPRRAAYLKQARRFLEEYILFNPFLKGLDPAYYPPDLVRFYARLRQKVLQERPFILRRTPEKKVASQVVVLRMTRTVQKGHIFLNLVPFGVPQFVNGHTTKGWIFFGGMVLGLAMNIGGYFVVDAMVIKTGEGAGKFRSIADANTATAFIAVQFVGLGLLAASWLAGSIDGIIFYKKQRESVLPDLPKVDPSLFRVGFRKHYQ
ncbi:MAG: hypothetical protein H6728_03360 [Myxococcales bacterium]|nr:hypothetical protein [Myxococcales bacterium]MCB9642088.1 hypothetical protein [Myxococcales bacterium]